jgi:hypothetical protein
MESASTARLRIGDAEPLSIEYLHYGHDAEYLGENGPFSGFFPSHRGEWILAGSMVDTEIVERFRFGYPLPHDPPGSAAGALAYVSYSSQHSLTCFAPFGESAPPNWCQLAMSGLGQPNVIATVLADDIQADRMVGYLGAPIRNDAGQVSRGGTPVDAFRVSNVFTP